MFLCDDCIHKDACKFQFQFNSAFFNCDLDIPLSFEDTVLTCSKFDDKSYYLRPKYRVGDEVWTSYVDENLANKVCKLIIEEIKYDHAEYDYLLSNGEWEQETELFNTKEECVTFLRKVYNKIVED